jgi:RNA polymerase sigma-70 factor (TIGR02960 family)
MELIDRARSGDAAAFAELIGPYRHEMQVHCYRILGSVADAEDALQETLAAAWQGLGGFEGRAAIRTWLYRIATSRCLNMLRAARRRPVVAAPSLSFEPPEPTRLGEVLWVEPYPDPVAGLPDTAAGPEARYEAREAISLAFVTALQLLPPRQRAVLILRDVLDFSAREAAGLLDTTEQSVTSALKRARATLSRELPSADRPAPPPGSPAEQALLSGLIRAYEDADVDALVTLLTDDVWVRMPPLPLEYQGRDVARHFFATVAFRQGRRYRMIPARPNGQPAFGCYLRDPHSHLAHANGLFVLTLSGDQISAITRFDNTAFPRFALPRTLPDD